MECEIRVDKITGRPVQLVMSSRTFEDEKIIASMIEAMSSGCETKIFSADGELLYTWNFEEHRE